MPKKILIVEDCFVEANNLRMILQRAGHKVLEVAESYDEALDRLATETPDFVLLDIFLHGTKTGIDLAKALREMNIAFIYLSANSNGQTLEAAKITEPYGFLVKPFREKDILIMLDIAHYLHEQKQKFRKSRIPNPPGIDLKQFKGIVGNSKALTEVMELIKIVAPTETSVLILGESGTGKERLVDSIHANSSRKNKPLIKVNCAALPSNLVETELFGHERGAFTGASEKRIGKFEQANGGTIFLDEVGEIPVDMQVKLLRVLQEKEIERIGGNGNFKVDVRIVAATNRNLEKEVAEGKFRIDLYYRLSVFPIFIPPLRDRPEDIPLLANHFVQQFCQSNYLPAKEITESAMQSLLAYSWPGNIRELEHLIERSVLLNPGHLIGQIAVPITDINNATSSSDRQQVKTIKELEAEHIRAVLRKCNGKISGPGGASKLLRLPYSTLISKMKALGIKKDRSFY